MACNLVDGYQYQHTASVEICNVTFTKRDRRVESVHWNNPQIERHNMKSDIKYTTHLNKGSMIDFVFMNLVKFVIWCCWFIITSTAAYRESILLLPACST